MVTSDSTRRLARPLFVVAVLLQLVVLYVPSTPEGPDVPGVDKLVHLAVFLLPAVLGALAGIRLVLLAALLAGHAVLSEVIQQVALPARSGDPWDVVADLVGVALGIAIGAALQRRAVRRRNGDRSPSPRACR